MALSRSNDRRLFEVAAAHGGVAHDCHIRAAGVSSKAVRRRIEQGMASRVLPSVVAVGPLCHAPTFDMQCSAAVLMGGEGALLDDVTAAAALGLWNRRVDVIHVSAMRSVRSVGDPYRFHQVRQRWDEPIVRGGMDCPVVGVRDLCMQLARSLEPWQLAYVIEAARYQRLIELTDLWHVVDERYGCPGNAVLRESLRLIGGGSAGTRSLTEDVFLQDLLRAGADMPRINVRGVMGMSRDEPDFYWPAGDEGRGHNIEMDGGHHELDSQRRDDAVRDAEVEARGTLVLRVTAQQFWRDRRRTIQQCIRFLRGETIVVEPGTRRLLA